MELNSPSIEEEDIVKLKDLLPPNLEGLAFESPINKFDEDTLSEVRVVDREPRIAEYLKGIGNKLEQLSQIQGALGFYNLAFRVGKNSDILMMKARMLGQAGHVDKAEKLLRRYLEYNPRAPEPYFLFGKNALGRADYENAFRQFLEAKERVRKNNVDHKKLSDLIEIHMRFVSIYLDRDKLFTRDLPPKKCIEEIERLRNRTSALKQDIQELHQPELDGMVFFLETQDKIFEKWLEEMTLS